MTRTVAHRQTRGAGLRPASGLVTLRPLASSCQVTVGGRPDPLPSDGGLSRRARTALPPASLSGRRLEP